MNRRGFIKGLLAAPVVITTPGLLMPVRPALASRFVFVDGMQGFWDCASHAWGIVHHDSQLKKRPPSETDFSDSLRALDNLPYPSSQWS